MRYLLLDRILSLEPGQRAVGIKNVTMSEDFLAHHFPRQPVMPGMLIVEAMVQLASWTLAAGCDFQQRALLCAIQRAKFKRFVRPGDCLRIEVSLQHATQDVASFNGRAQVDAQEVTSAQFTVSLVPAEQLEDPTAARAFFQVLTRA